MVAGPGLKIKICGVRNLDDARAAAAAGADYVGIVFVPGRHRRIDVDAATVISQGLRAGGGVVPQVVGLFADQDLNEVNAVVRSCGLGAAQLCGQETLDYASRVDCPVIKVIHVPASATNRSDGAFDARIQEFRNAGHRVTLDRLVEGVQGGTGQGFDWEVAAALSGHGHEFLLAGGLTPANVARAIATVRPWGVDVSSGVETGGKKDHKKIRDFITTSRNAAAEHGQLQSTKEETEPHG